MPLPFTNACRWAALLALAAGALAGPAAAQGPGAPAAAQGPAAAEVACGLVPLAPAARAAGAPLIAEAQVLDAQSFWDAGHRHLFTRHRLRVFSLLKGSAADTVGLVVVTEGGQLGLNQQVLTNTLRLAPGQQGVLFLAPAPWPGLGLTGPAYAAYGSAQGFVAYDLAHATAADPVRAYPAIDAAFYQALDPQGAQTRRALQPNPALAVAQARRLAAAKGTAVATISGIQPAQLTAGTGAVLTIRGSGFGEARGAGFVEFANADDGGRTFEQPLAADYLAWADGAIQVRVPSTGVGGHPAGSGLVRVTPDGGTVGASPQLLTVVYALSNVKSTDAQPTVQRPNHVATNGLGGITFHFAPNFADNAAASAAWQRALASWRCQTGMNWALGDAAPTNDIASDGQSTVAFDLASTALPAGVLGRTTSYYQGCFAADRSVIFYVGEVDMQFSTAAVFQFGPALALGLSIDFETVAVHELGHAQQLAHLIRPGAIMHYAVSRGQNSRRLSAESDVAGGRLVLRTRSFRNRGCGGPALLPAPLTALSAAVEAGAPGPVLRWATQAECFLAGFVVERSAGLDTAAATAGWLPVATVALGAPGGNYQVTDAQPAARLVYYRLALLRPDGTRDYAAPLPVAPAAAPVADLFPNPVTGTRLSLQYPAAGGATSLVYSIYDELGRRYRLAAAAVQPGLNVLTFDVGALPPGFYLFRWQDENGRSQSRKFLRL
ncbi:matrixin family metalloprotease [Hymenobacter nivis]|uniref:T9SS C-terminal target domain-containing protein n=1 Tax=Hymenobacter nivis TaxID=1850093 RepID=A0A502GVS8_9BACT|nr:matrixin family metalloprotease [Hymenobacter nivis]TPG65508.1 T9SS C-terminal target domain-containing protein [Hymenobacter nivis]